MGKLFEGFNILCINFDHVLNKMGDILQWRILIKEIWYATIWNIFRENVDSKELWCSLVKDLTSKFVARQNYLEVRWLHERKRFDIKFVVFWWTKCKIFAARKFEFPARCSWWLTDFENHLVMESEKCLSWNNV